MFKYTIAVLCLLVASSYGASLRPKHIPRFPTRIVGGSDTDITKHPHQIQLLYGGSLLCGGSILNENTVISAGHCVDGFNDRYFTVLSGSTTLEKGTSHKVTKIFRNPKYDDVTTDYDVSILKVDPEFEFGDTTQPISIIDKEPQEGDDVVVTGWGATSEGGATLPSHLQEVTVPVVDRKTCNENYDIYGGITLRMFCAGEEGRDSCQGDSGGPVTVGARLAGIVSWGEGCAERGYPGVYTNVADPEITDFINDHIDS